MMSKVINSLKPERYIFAILTLFLLQGKEALSQKKFNAWLSTCSHLVGPTGNPKSFNRAVRQSKGLDSRAQAFDWDVIIDVGDWTASQNPPSNEEGEHVAKVLNETFGKDRGRFFTVAGNHDGEACGWKPGDFTQKYVNPLGESQFAATSGFEQKERPQDNDFRQLLDYPGTRWDRYLVRTGNVVWIMMGDRNEFDELAIARNDLSGQYQAGRGSDGGLPKGGYPSGAVTLDTFQWWKQVVEDKQFSNDILITVHHHMPALTTITTEDGEPGEFHGKSGSVGPNGEIGGQLYWIREYNKEGKEINQYAQTRPFINYLKDNPGAIAAWVGGHSHIHTSDQEINGRGIHVRKYGVSFISIGAITDSHAPGVNQMSRLLTFVEGSDEAMVNVYIHRSSNKHGLGWDTTAVRKVELGKKFICPENAKNGLGPIVQTNVKSIPDAPSDSKSYRYLWSLDGNNTFDFNHDKFVVGNDGSPYGSYHKSGESLYSNDTPTKEGKSFKLHLVNGGISFNLPYTPLMNWNSLSLGIWIKLINGKPQTLLYSGKSYGSAKFKLRYDGQFLIWEVGVGNSQRVVRCKVEFNQYDNKWVQVLGVADQKNQEIRLFTDGNLAASKRWKSKGLVKFAESEFILGDKKYNEITSSEALVKELIIYDYAINPAMTDN